MRFREATLGDIPQLVEHGEEFWTHTIYFRKGRPYSKDTVCDLCEWLINGGGFIVVLADDNDSVRGFGLVVVTPFIFDQSFTSALELAYYIAPEARGHFGVALMKQMEKKAREMGASFMSMITMEDSSPEVAAAVYERLGYEKNEVVYTKELKDAQVG